MPYETNVLTQPNNGKYMRVQFERLQDRDLLAAFGAELLKEIQLNGGAEELATELGIPFEAATRLVTVLNRTVLTYVDTTIDG